MKFKQNQKLKVIDNTTNHLFKVGIEVVVIRVVPGTQVNQLYVCRAVDNEYNVSAITESDLEELI